MMHAAHSWWQSTNGSPWTRAASITSRFEPPPGTPKMRATPAWRSPSTTSSASVGIGDARSAGGEPREHRTHAIERLAQVGLGVGVGEPQVALAVLAERGARERRHTGLLQERLGYCTRGPLE